ncbi:hypothetical protein KIW84_051459 [Lathyrus oleraceus]|uniref:Reverse transcriptase domain-containing protein n=1 Tax=Pisum sativum TaxID=3888 RepID=A0A9D4WMJ6_PEA|nr:hypothetical protein KIW84_051459 [Pisum sativum]
MSLQLADRSVKYPIGILEDVPVRIGQLFIPTNFVVMDIKEDNDIPILLGRPFLSTAGAIIDVKKGKLTFDVDIIDECVRELEQEEIIKTIKLPSTLIRENDDLKKPYIDDNLYECLSLTPDPIPCPKKPTLELKEIPKNLRYDFLDEKMNRLVIVSATLS